MQPSILQENIKPEITPLLVDISQAAALLEWVRLS